MKAILTNTAVGFRTLIQNRRVSFTLPNSPAVIDGILLSPSAHRSLVRFTENNRIQERRIPNIRLCQHNPEPAPVQPLSTLSSL